MRGRRDASVEVPYSKERRRVLRAAIFDQVGCWYFGKFLGELELFGGGVEMDAIVFCGESRKLRSSAYAVMSTFGMGRCWISATS